MKLMITGLFAVLFGILASTADATVINTNSIKITQDQDQVKIYVETFEQSAMCALKITKLNIEKPEDVYPSEILSLGRISVEFETDPNAICLMAFGPHRGTLTLVKGEQLPAISKGEQYIVEVNGYETALTLEVL